MPRKKSTTKQKQKQSQKQNVKQTVIVKVGESARRRRRRAPSKKTEEGTSTAYPYMGMTLPPPVIYQTGPAFDAPRLQAFQDFEYPRFSKAGEAAMRRAEPAAPVLEDIGLIGSSEIIDVKNKKEQLAELGDLVPPPAKAAAKAGEAAMKRAEGAKARLEELGDLVPVFKSPLAKELMARVKPPPPKSAAVKEMLERAKTRPMMAPLKMPVPTTASFNEPFGIAPEGALTDSIPGPAFATPYLPGQFEPMKYKAPAPFMFEEFEPITLSEMENYETIKNKPPFGYYEEEEAPVVKPKRKYIKKTPEQKEAERIKKEERQRRREQKLSK
jgi:hypothetical protein